MLHCLSLRKVSGNARLSHQTRINGPSSAEESADGFALQSAGNSTLNWVMKNQLAAPGTEPPEHIDPTWDQLCASLQPRPCSDFNSLPRTPCASLIKRRWQGKASIAPTWKIWFGECVAAVAAQKKAPLLPPLLRLWEGDAGRAVGWLWLMASH